MHLDSLPNFSITFVLSAYLSILNTKGNMKEKQGITRLNSIF